MTTQDSDNAHPDVSAQPAVDSRQGAIPAGRRSLRERRRRCLRNLLLVVLATICLNAAVASLLITWRTPSVVSFDMKGTVDQFTEQAGSRSLNEAQTAALTSRFMSILSEELQLYQHRHDALILVSPAVVSGTADITEDIQSAVALRMAAEGGQ